jgi:hypothetical protein
MKRIITAIVLVAALIVPASAMALEAADGGKTMLTADGWYYEELPDGTIHSIYITISKRPGARFGQLWFTESWGVPVQCDNGTKRTSDDWLGYEWSVREGSGEVAFRLNRSLRHTLAEGDIPFTSYGYSDCDLVVEPGVIGGVDAGTVTGSAGIADQLPGTVLPGEGPTIHIVLSLDGYGRLQRPDVIAYAEDAARCPGGPDGTRCGGGSWNPGLYRDAIGTLVLDDILYQVDGRLSRLRTWIEPIHVGAEVPVP